MNLPPAGARRTLFLIGALSLVLAAILIGRSDAAQRVFGAASPDEAATVLRGFGLWTPLVSILLMVLQSVLSPLPGSLVAAANGALYGIWWGTLLSWIGGMAGGWRLMRLDARLAVCWRSAGKIHPSGDD